MIDSVASGGVWMSDPVSAARAARENLARGLGALQSPGVPPQFMSVAEPVAHAMSALHRIEASRWRCRARGRACRAGRHAPGAGHAATQRRSAPCGRSRAGGDRRIARLDSPALASRAPARRVALCRHDGRCGNSGPGLRAARRRSDRTQPSQAMGYQPRPEAAPQVAYAQPPIVQPPPPPQAWPAPAARRSRLCTTARRPRTSQQPQLPPLLRRPRHCTCGAHPRRLPARCASRPSSARTAARISTRA